MNPISILNRNINFNRSETLNTPINYVNTPILPMPPPKRESRKKKEDSSKKSAGSSTASPDSPVSVAEDAEHLHNESASGAKKTAPPITLTRGAVPRRTPV